MVDIEFQYCLSNAVGNRRRVISKSEIKNAYTVLFEDTPLLSTHFIQNPAFTDMVLKDGVDASYKIPTDALLESFEKSKLTLSELQKAFLCDESTSASAIIEDNLKWNETSGIRIPYGAALYRLVSCLNHSCQPNAIVVFGKNQKAYVISVRSISEGEEITIGYADFGSNDCAYLWGSDSPLPFECFCKTCFTACEKKLLRRPVQYTLCLEKKKRARNFIFKVFRAFAARNERQQRLCAAL